MLAAAAQRLTGSNARTVPTLRPFSSSQQDAVFDAFWGWGGPSNDFDRRNLTTNVTRTVVHRGVQITEPLRFLVGTRAALRAVMQKTIVIEFRKATLLTVAVSIGALSGCGDAGMFSRGKTDAGAIASIGAEINSANVRVGHHSTRCDANAAAPCPKGMDPAVEIHVEGRSLILDFSNVAEPGSFADVDFEGYVLEITPGADSPILAAWVDTDATTLDVEDAHVSYDEGHLEVNLAGVPYDPGGFVKIDLLVGPLNLLGRGAE